MVTALGATFSALHQWAVERGADRLGEQRKHRALGDPTRQLPAAEEDLADLRRVEFAALSDGDWQAALDAMAAAAGRRALSSAALGPDGIEAFDRLLTECCRRIARRARAVDEVMHAIQATMAGEITQLRRQVETLGGQPDRRARSAADAFERHYQSYLAGSYATFELFQVGLGRAPARHSFTEFCSVPSVARRSLSPGDTALTGTGTDAAHALAADRHVLLIGGAGAGKTTLLQWLAHTAATAALRAETESDDPWRGVVPFFVPLRQFADRDLPEPEDLVRVSAPALAGGKPAGWVSALLRSGGAMVLVDGVDEVLQPRREDVRRRLEGLLRGYPEARYVISTRPSAVDEPVRRPDRRLRRHRSRGDVAASRGRRRIQRAGGRRARPAT